MEHDSTSATTGAAPRKLSALEERQQKLLINRVAQEMALRVEPDWNSAPLSKEEREIADLTDKVHAVRVQKLDERWRVFLERLSANGGILTLTLKQCGFTQLSLRKRRLNHPGFEDQFIAALDAGVDKLEDVAKHRALYGVVRPIFYRGRKVSEVHEVSDDLLKFMLRAHRPEKYGNKLELSGQLDFTGIDFSRLSEIELEAIAANRATQELIDRIRNAQALPALPVTVAGNAAQDAADSESGDGADEPASVGGEPRSS